MAVRSITSCGGTGPMATAYSMFVACITEEEKQEYGAMTAEDIMQHIERLEKSRMSFSRTIQLGNCLRPVVAFLQRYTSTIDTFIQADPFPSAIVWGTIKALLNVAASHILYFDKLVCMVQKVSDMLPIYREYEAILRSSKNLQSILAEVYYSILLFLRKARIVFSRKGPLSLARSIWRTFESDFSSIISDFERNTNLLQELIKLSNTMHIQEIVHGQEKLIRDGAVQRSLSMQISANLQDSDLERRRKIMNWVSENDPEVDFIRESRRRIESSGKWILQHPLFEAWITSQNRSTLRITGCPGSGKTVLSTTIIEYLQNLTQNSLADASCVAYFYCSKSQQNQDAFSILAGLMKQILSQSEELPYCVIECFEKSTKAGRSALSIADRPENLLRSICKLFGNLYMVVDGLDELSDPKDSIGAILALMNTVDNARTIFLSREIPQADRILASYPTIKLDNSNTNEDVNRYILEQLKQLEFYDDKLQTQIFQNVCQEANGMFLWANFMMDSLSTATSLEDALEIVSSMPMGLDEFYQSVMHQIAHRKEKTRVLAERVLLLMCCSPRPLTWKELECILNASEDKGKHPKVSFPSAVLRTCSPFIEYVASTDVFRFVHASVGEFLIDPKRHGQEPPWIFGPQFTEASGHAGMANTCLAYLLQVDNERLSSSTEIRYPLLQYATIFWGFHLLKSPYSPKLSQRMQEYLSVKERRMNWISRQLFRESSGFPLQNLIKLQKKLYEWDAGNSETCDRESRLDWIHDVSRIMVETDTSAGMEIHPNLGYTALAGENFRITYFERLMVIRDLSREYTIRQRLDEAENWIKAALEEKRSKFGDNNLSTVWLLNSLGIIYDQQHRVELSARTHESALSIQEAQLGKEHLETVWTINELGRVYRHLGRYDDAVSMHLRALKILQKLLPEDDLQIAWTMNTVARALRKKGNTIEALEYHEQAIDIQKKSLEEQHPHILWATADIGRCYRDRGEIGKSVWFHRKCLEGRIKTLGTDHPDTFWAMNDLGLVLSEDGHLREARQLHKRALEGQTKFLGQGHPHTVWSRKQIESIKERKEFLE